jgi:hypothetical protein
MPRPIRGTTTPSVSTPTRPARTGGTTPANPTAPTSSGGTHPAGWHPKPAPKPAAGTTTPAKPATPKPFTRPNAAVHFEGTPTFEGATLKASVLKDAYRDVKANEFGTTDVELPQPDGTTKTFQVRDMHYDLGDGKTGMRLVPVKDHDAAAAKKMDALLRKEMGLKAKDPLFAYVSYIHPEEHSGNLKQLGTEMVKTEMGTTHLGAYVGGGRTTNSPENYHDTTWSVKGYPANVQVISMKGTDQATLNKNLLAADSVLNKGVQFPPDYKNDPLRTVDLNTTLMFYRDWLSDAPYLKTDPTWFTYCAEHKTIVTNVGLNVPHNADSFKEIFGPTDGPALWEKFKTKFKEANGREFTSADETKFEPLWKKDGLSAADIRPPTKAEYDAYQKARFDGSLKSGAYRGYQPLPVGKAMAWKPETTADLVKNFMETYAPFDKVGGYASAATILGFKDVVGPRMGLDDTTYIATAMPILDKIMVAEALARAPADPAGLAKWTEQAAAGLYVAFGGKPSDLAPGGTVDAQRMGLAKACLQAIPTAAPQLAQLAQLPPDKRNEAAYTWMRGAIASDMDKARAVMVSDPSKTEFYSPPAVTNRVVNGLVDADPNVSLRVVATAVDASEVQ